MLPRAYSPRDAEYVPPAREGEQRLMARADYATTNKLTPFISMQNHYNLLYREEEREMLPTLKARPLPSLRLVLSCVVPSFACAQC